MFKALEAHYANMTRSADNIDRLPMPALDKVKAMIQSRGPSHTKSSDNVFTNTYKTWQLQKSITEMQGSGRLDIIKDHGVTKGFGLLTGTVSGLMGGVHEVIIQILNKAKEGAHWAIHSDENIAARLVMLAACGAVQLALSIADPAMTLVKGIVNLGMLANDKLCKASIINCHYDYKGRSYEPWYRQV